MTGYTIVVEHEQVTKEIEGNKLCRNTSANAVCQEKLPTTMAEWFHLLAFFTLLSKNGIAISEELGFSTVMLLARSTGSQLQYI